MDRKELLRGSFREGQRKAPSALPSFTTAADAHCTMILSGMTIDPISETLSAVVVNRLVDVITAKAHKRYWLRAFSWAGRPDVPLASAQTLLKLTRERQSPGRLDMILSDESAQPFLRRLR